MARGSFAILGTVVMLLAALAPLGVAAADSGELAIDVTQHDDESATVTVTDNGTAVQNASVTVETTAPGVSYDGAGNYTTDENGTVGLPSPNHSVRVLVTATVDNTSVATETMLIVEDEEEEEEEEDDDGNETDDGDGNETDDGDGPDFTPFGQQLQEFKESLGDVAVPGLAIADWVTANNPAAGMNHTPDHAGPPDDHPVFGDDNETDGNETDGNETDGNETDDSGVFGGLVGPPADHPVFGTDDSDDNDSDDGPGAGPPADHPVWGDDNESDDGDRGQGGPPDHAGQDDGDDEDDGDAEDAEDDEDDEDDDEADGDDAEDDGPGGPPDDHPGNGNGSDNGHGNGGNGHGGNGNGHGGGPP